MEDEMREEINEEVIKEVKVGETIANGEEEVPTEEIKGE